MGRAIADYYHSGVADRLRVFSPMFDEDEIPVDILFRGYDEMSAIEQRALDEARGKVLDVGAGAGCHSLFCKMPDAFFLALLTPHEASYAMSLLPMKDSLHHASPVFLRIN